MHAHAGEVRAERGLEAVANAGIERRAAPDNPERANCAASPPESILLTAALPAAPWSAITFAIPMLEPGPAVIGPATAACGAATGASGCTTGWTGAFSS
jgi:hypothetical protein